MKNKITPKEVNDVDIIKKPKGKSKAIVIDKDTRDAIRSFKDRYKELLELDPTDDEIRPIDRISIQVILNELDEFDQNILIAFYAIADSSPSQLAKIFCVSPSLITSRINKIQKYVRDRSITIADDSGICY